MKKILVLISCIVVTGFFLGNGFAGSGKEELCIPLGTITLSPPEGVEAERSSVEFPHSVHFDYNCRKCHHEWTGDAADLSCMTSGCHDSSTSLLATDKDEAYRYYKTAYHEQCIVCHKEINEENQKREMSIKGVDGVLSKTGPTGCIGCHPKP